MRDYDENLCLKEKKKDFSPLSGRPLSKKIYKRNVSPEICLMFKNASLTAK